MTSSTEEILKSIIADYKKTENSTCVGHELLKKCEEIRESITIIAIRHLININEITDEIEKAKNQSSQAQTVLNFFDYLIDGFPPVVFVPSFEQYRLMWQLDSEQSMLKYTKFLYLLTSHLIQILTLSELDVLHGIAYKILLLWMQLMKMQNVKIYEIFLNELVNLFKELHLLQKQHYPMDDGKHKVGNIFLKSFIASKSQNVTAQPLVVSSFENFEKWQIACTDLLQVCSTDVACFLQHTFDHLLLLSIEQILKGGIRLKIASLKLCSSLLNSPQNLSEKVMHRLITSVISFVNYFVFEKDDDKYKEFGRQEENTVEFYKTLSDFLFNLFKIECNQQDEPAQHWFKTCFQVDLHYLSLLASNLASKIDKPTIICETTLHLCNFMTVNAFNHSQNSDISEKLVKNLYKISHFLILNFHLVQNVHLYMTALTNFFSLFCYLQSICSSNSLTSVSSQGSLSCKRKSGSDVPKKFQNYEKGNLTCLIDLLQCHFSNTVSQQQHFFSKVKHDKTSSILKQLQVNIKRTSAVFESFLNALVLLQNVDTCKNIMIVTFQKLTLNSIFCNYVEFFVNYIGQLKLPLDEIELDYAQKTFKDLLHLAKLFVTWHYCACYELTKVPDQETKKSLVAALVIFSSVWLQDLPWRDFDKILISSIPKPCLLSFCRHLQLSNYCEFDEAHGNNQNLSFIKTAFQGLALIPANLAPAWRISVLAEWALSSHQDEVALISLEMIPILCTSLKCSSLTPIVADIISFIKSKNNLEKNLSAVSALSGCFEVLILVFSGNFVVSIQFKLKDYKIELISKIRLGSKDNCLILEDDRLTLINEFEKRLYSFLKTIENGKSNPVWCAVLMNLINGLNYALQHVEKHHQTFLRLLSQWLKYIVCNYDMKLVEPLFISFEDNLDIYVGFFLRETESMLQDALKNHQVFSLCNLTRLFGFLIEFCASHNHTDHELFLKPFQCLCKVLCSSFSRASSLAYCKLEKFAVNYHSVLDNHRKSITTSFVLGLVDSSSKCRPALHIFEDAARLYATTLNNFVSSNIHYLLPPIILREVDDEQSKLLLIFSTALQSNKTDLIKQNFKHIFCYAVTSGADLEMLFKFLENQTKIRKESLVLMTYGSLIQHLMAHVSINRDGICNALEFVHKVNSSKESNLSVSELLKPHFLSVLTFFNSQLRLASIAKAEKLQVFESLICLLYLLDTSYVTAVFVKVVNTLCLAQQVFINSTNAGICCKAWHALAHCLEDSSLGGFLSQIVVMLLPCLEKYPIDVANTLEFLVIEKYQYTKFNFSELYFLPDHPVLKKVKLKINLEQNLSKSLHSDFFHTLRQANCHLSHDSVEVRIYALAQVRTILQSNQKALQRHCLISGGVSDLVRSLVSTLLCCCRDSNSKIKLLAAKCLGEIGAVDPDRLGLIVNNSKPKDFVCISFDDEDFAFNLLNCLVQAFLVAKPSHQDISAFAIQELLKIYKCKDDSKDAHGRHLWRRFSDQVQAVLEPHLSSRYVLKKSETNLSTLKRPILHRKANMTFRDWIGTFSAVLLQMASAAAKDSSIVRGVFDACASVVRGDVNVALFLLPSTVVEVLKSGDQHLEFLQEEILAVLDSTELLQDSKKLQKPINKIIESEFHSLGDNALKKVPHTTLPYSSHLSQLSTQAVFAIFDHITLWMHKSSISSVGGAISRTKLKEKEQAIKFLSLIPQKNLAFASLHCKDYTRALLHYETYLRESPDSTLSDDSAAFLQRIFIEINEPDGVLGVVNVRGTEPTLETQLLVFESAGALQDAASCYERIICNDPSNVSHYKGFFKCLVDLGQLSEAVNLVDGTVANNPSWKNDLTTYCVEACWRLGNWDLLEKKVKSLDEHRSWSVAIGKAILSIRDKKWKKLDELLNDLYQSQTDSLSVACMETNSFQRGYEQILRLHTLSDLERFSNIVRDQSKLTTIDDAVSLWKLRLQVVQPSFRACDPLLSLGRALLPLIYKTNNRNVECDRYVGKMWLESSRLARECDLLQTAYGALFSAKTFSLPGYCIEHAKLLLKKGESHQALMVLQRGFAEHFSSVSPTLSLEERRERAKVMLFEAKLMEESSSYDSNVVLRKYKEVVSFMNDWEDSHFFCGRYYDKLMTTMMGENRTNAKANHLYYIMYHYGRSLCFGTSHIYESLTKLLTLWLDYGETAAKHEKAGKPQSIEDVQRLGGVIVDVRSRLPAYVFYVAFSQLTSRICHQHEPTYNQLKEILISVILAFPQRALWSMMAMSKSSFQLRATRCQEIFNRVQYKEPKLTKLLTDSISLTNRLLDLCNKPVSTTQPLSIGTHFKQLKKLVESNQFSQIMLPLQKFMNVVLPQTKQNTMFDSQASHEPFPEPVSHIVGFDDTVEILSSLQRPKKISVRASDGRSYAFLCKPKDDLRKDARLTEFAAIVNKCLNRDAESGKRHLRIRTYAVIPLNEECGLIEWVNNLKGLRHILLPIYKAKSIYCSAKQLKSWQVPASAPVEKKLLVFRTKFLARHPPVFHEWFLTTFPEPSSWYSARMSYARSIAVMSMVGYMLGLGDRHGENILFDSNSGEAMHVDFNCLFNKGLSLEVPEIVPFRLTHNMVDAMGPTKYEGFFRKACEVTMNVLREQREPLMSVLKTFIYDPLVEWSKKSRGSAPGSSGEILTEKALNHVNDIDKRLRGVVGKNKGLPLSIEGHVHYLIQEATEEEKLCQMYIGWAPFM